MDTNLVEINTVRTIVAESAFRTINMQDIKGASDFFYAVKAHLRFSTKTYRRKKAR
ncbi:hypothetical protein [Arcticibacter eurypsychrophilus]|uniref:hypothetical protein n=1 Tax=Arcticibacter eurypsychrophilus TaxID=1434752 RepID=UPI00147E412B|nr:hypothetical protein [Arcticibacter eurypsychrophilus]